MSWATVALAAVLCVSCVLFTALSVAAELLFCLSAFTEGQIQYALCEIDTAKCIIYQLCYAQGHATPVKKHGYC